MANGKAEIKQTNEQAKQSKIAFSLRYSYLEDSRI